MLINKKCTLSNETHLTLIAILLVYKISFGGSVLVCNKISKIKNSLSRSHQFSKLWYLIPNQKWDENSLFIEFVLKGIKKKLKKNVYYIFIIIHIIWIKNIYCLNLLENVES